MSFSLSVLHFTSLSFLLCSHIRECLKLDQDDKDCFSQYKQVKKLSKQLDTAEELIHMERSVLINEKHNNKYAINGTKNNYKTYL